MWDMHVLIPSPRLRVPETAPLQIPTDWNSAYCLRMTFAGYQEQWPGSCTDWIWSCRHASVRLCFRAENKSSQSVFVHAKQAKTNPGKYHKRTIIIYNPVNNFPTVCAGVWVLICCSLCLNPSLRWFEWDWCGCHGNRNHHIQHDLSTWSLNTEHVFL